MQSILAGELARQYTSVIRGWWEYYGASIKLQYASSFGTSTASSSNGQTQVQDAVAA